MSWTNELYQIYENNCGKEDEKIVLLPLSHSTAKAQIEVTLSDTGAFVTSTRIEDKGDSVTIIPVTEDSGSRGAGINPHPFADKLIYIAGDYNRYVEGGREEDGKYYQAYMEQLQEWKESEYGHPAVRAVFEYLRKKTLIHDLVESHSLILDEHTAKLKKKEKIAGIDQKDAFVRFRINYSDLFGENKTWKDRTLYESYCRYNQILLKNIQLCYATGKMESCTYKHPSKIRNAGDKAKLISTNDENGFTYRGRFASKEQAISVSYDFSQKMHNALKWLIEKQGIAIGSMELLTWASNLQPLPNILEKLSNEDKDFEDTWEDDWDVAVEKDKQQLQSDTMSLFRNRVRRVIWGNCDVASICAEMDSRLKVMIMVLDAATTGRLSMSLCEELSFTEFYENLERWHCDTAWTRFNGKKKINELDSFSLYEIVDYAYGTEQGDFIKCKTELRSKMILRLIPCVTDGRDVPLDIMMNLFHKACVPAAYKKSYNWRNVLEAACGLIRKKIVEEKGEYKVGLDKTCKERDYLYGRLLAIAEVAEASTYDANETRMTNASRYFEAFSNRPYQTWGVIQERLNPYFRKMGAKRSWYYTKLIMEIDDLFEKEVYKDNSKLKPIFLLAYYCQLSELYKGKDKSKDDSEGGN